MILVVKFKLYFGAVLMPRRFIPISLLISVVLSFALEQTTTADAFDLHVSVPRISIPRPHVSTPRIYASRPHISHPKTYAPRPHISGQRLYATGKIYAKGEKYHATEMDNGTQGTSAPYTVSNSGTTASGSGQTAGGGGTGTMVAGGGSGTTSGPARFSHCKRAERCRQ